MTNLVSIGGNSISPRPNHAPRPAKAASRLPQPPGQHHSATIVPETCFPCSYYYMLGHSHFPTLEKV
ncbi:hypothetical protein BS47DRAFT_1338694 [Hydnum rufescens UP504]|uniref:Uncharacterized protein n=1 Tax=Hydnum rufescens UP504 TaxID=1448309 RepID=A0A9P6B5I4_9AGAM|nr:hypothetical protein BS47DRAFT_1338694 [Hydnum rufescens UP504]